MCVCEREGEREGGIVKESEKEREREKMNTHKRTALNWCGCE